MAWKLFHNFFSPTFPRWGLPRWAVRDQNLLHVSPVYSFRTNTTCSPSLTTSLRWTVSTPLISVYTGPRTTRRAAIAAEGLRMTVPTRPQPPLHSLKCLPLPPPWTVPASTTRMLCTWKAGVWPILPTALCSLSQVTTGVSKGVSKVCSPVSRQQKGNAGLERGREKAIGDIFPTE